MTRQNNIRIADKDIYKTTEFRGSVEDMPGPPFAIYNPHNKPAKNLPVIYGFNNGGGDNWWYGQLLSEDGYALGSHICSNESFMLHDLGISVDTRKDRHEGFRETYPDGYRMDFVGIEEVPQHTGLQAAIERYKTTSTEE